MATVKQYVNQLRPTARRIATQMGVDVGHSMMGERVVARTTLAMIAGLIKLLVDKGVISDADLQAAFNAAAGETYDPEPQEVAPDP